MAVYLIRLVLDVLIKIENNNNFNNLLRLLLMNSFDKTFEENTLLNRIIQDLRSIIWKYFKTFSPLVIGKYERPSYIGYRMIQKKDLFNDIFLENFMKCYGKGGGFHSIDSFEGNILCGRGFVMSYEAYALRCTLTNKIHHNEFIKIEKDDYVLFQISSRNNIYFMNAKMLDYVYFNVFNNSKQFKKVGLYVIENKK